MNSKGYKVLPDCVRVIQGDGIDVESLPKILDNLLAAGWSADNLAFGMGGGMLQHVNRDTQKFAMKCSAIFVDGEWRNVFKCPAGDLSKASKRGRLMLTLTDGKWATEQLTDIVRDELRLVYANGFVTVTHVWDDVVYRVNA